MYKYEDQKEMRSALNGKLIVMMVGLFLILTAVTSTFLQGIQYVLVANSAKGGMKEAVELLEKSTLTIGKAYGVGTAYIISGIVEIVVGIISVKFSNRLDKVKVCLSANMVLLVTAFVRTGYLMIMSGIFNPFALIAALLMPLLLLWGVTRLVKLAKKYPDRTYAVEPNPAKKRKDQQPQKKNLMERAKAQVKDEAMVSRVVDEITEEKE